jgi:hypothetical protein
MNRFLANAVGALNALVALVIVTVGGLAAFGYGLQFAPRADAGFYAIVGVIAGVVAAVMICGLLAVLIDTRDTLRTILARVDEGAALMRVGNARAEPKFTP